MLKKEIFLFGKPRRGKNVEASLGEGIKKSEKKNCRGTGTTKPPGESVNTVLIIFNIRVRPRVGKRIETASNHKTIPPRQKKIGCSRRKKR